MESWLCQKQYVKQKKSECCLLMKSLYGLKQAPRYWNQQPNKTLVNYGFKRSMHVYCLYTSISRRTKDWLILIIYLDVDYFNFAKWM